jgi:hypothetical protein
MSVDRSIFFGKTPGFDNIGILTVILEKLIAWSLHGKNWAGRCDEDPWGY